MRMKERKEQKKKKWKMKRAQRDFFTPLYLLSSDSISRSIAKPRDQGIIVGNTLTKRS